MIKKKRTYYTICREPLDDIHNKGKYYLSNDDFGTWVKREMAAHEFQIKLFATEQKAKDIMELTPKWVNENYKESIVEVTVEFNI